jgi:hypothetical protein
MIARRWIVPALLAGLLLSSAALAALAGPHFGRPPAPAGARDVAYQFDGTYTWPPLVTTNATGSILERFQPDGQRVPHAVQQLLPGGGAEPTAGVTSKGNLFVVAGETVYRSNDHGRTWAAVHTFTTPNYPVTVDRFHSADPLLWVDPDTDRVFVLHMTIFYDLGTTWCNDMAYSDDEGETWTGGGIAANTYCDMFTQIDHPKLMTAKPGPRASLQPSGYPNVVYLCSNHYQQATTWCAVSLDGGKTLAYSRHVREPTLQDLQGVIPLRDANPPPGCPGINGHPAAFPDGTVAVPLCGGFRNPYSPIVGVTEDNGLTWRVSEFPGRIGQVEIDPDITVTPDGTAYMLFRGKDQLVHLLRSRDKFVTWEGPFRISPEDHVMGAFTAMASGDDGALVMAYLGTRDDQSTAAGKALPENERRPPEPSTARPGTHWHLFVTTTRNANEDEPRFVTQQVTPDQDPVQVGCIWMYGGSHVCRNLLDFIDAARDRDGRFYVAFTDGCTPRFGCTADTDLTRFQSTDRQVSVAVQTAGPSLFAANGLLPPLDLVPPGPNPR